MEGENCVGLRTQTPRSGCSVRVRYKSTVSQWKRSDRASAWPPKGTEDKRSPFLKHRSCRAAASRPPLPAGHVTVSLPTEPPAPPSLPAPAASRRFVATHSKQTHFQLSYRHHLLGAQRLRILWRSRFPAAVPSSTGRGEQLWLFLGSPSRYRSHERSSGSSLRLFGGFLTQTQHVQNICASAHFGRRGFHSWVCCPLCTATA